MRKIWIAVIVSGLFSCDGIYEEKPNERDQEEQNEVGLSFVDEIEFAKYCALQFEENSFYGLEGFIDGGVLLSPYAYIEELSVRKVSLKELSALENEEVFWGLYDGTGDSILLPLSDYLDKYVSTFDINDENVKTTSYEGKPEPHGSELHNMHKLYPDAVYVEFYLPPSEEGGLDWKSLIFVVSKVDGSFLLDAIIHNQWTV